MRKFASSIINKWSVRLLLPVALAATLMALFCSRGPRFPTGAISEVRVKYTASYVAESPRDAVDYGPRELSSDDPARINRFVSVLRSRLRQARRARAPEWAPWGTIAIVQGSGARSVYEFAPATGDGKWLFSEYEGRTYIVDKRVLSEALGIVGRLPPFLASEYRTSNTNSRDGRPSD